jgi:hypothetical protein
MAPGSDVLAWLGFNTPALAWLRKALVLDSSSQSQSQSGGLGLAWPWPKPWLSLFFLFFILQIRDG